MLSLRDLDQLLGLDIAQGPADAMLNTTGLQPVSDASQAEIALPCLTADFVEGHRTGWACRDAEPASAAVFPVHHDDPVLPLYDSTVRAALQTGRVLAMEAQGGEIIEVELIRHFSGLHGDHTAPFRTGCGREVVLLPAGDLTGVAADTTIQDDQHPLGKRFHLFAFVSHGK